MNQIIRNMLVVIPHNSLFDAHFVIGELIRLHSDEYLSFSASIGESRKSTEAIHSLLAKEISDFEGSFLTRIENKSWSMNIHGNPSHCTAWIRN